MDVRIEAILYAQEGSFFVLPGNWFNPNSADLWDPTTSRSAQSRPGGVDPRFPFYGDALDVRVIIDGAVGENITAESSDVGAWMAKWGQIPETYGSSGISTHHPDDGLTMLYDDHVGWPYSNLGSSPAVPIRTDDYCRTLPITPKLPVSNSLIYFGDVM